MAHVKLTELLTEADKKPDFLKLINAKLKELGVKKKAKQSDLQDKMQLLDSGKINPSTLGFIGNMFEDLTFEVRVGSDPDYGGGTVVILIEFDYHHPGGGHNGNATRYTYTVLDGNKWKTSGR